MGLCGGQRSILGILLSEPFTLLFETGSLARTWFSVIRLVPGHWGPLCPYLPALGLQALATMSGFICECWGSCSCHTHIMWSLESLNRTLLYYLPFSAWGETRLHKATCFSASFQLWPSVFPLLFTKTKQISKQTTSQSKLKPKPKHSLSQSIWSSSLSFPEH